MTTHYNSYLWVTSTHCSKVYSSINNIAPNCIHIKNNKVGLTILAALKTREITSCTYLEILQ